MAEVSPEYSGPYVGQPMVDGRYQPFMNAVHQGLGGALVEGGAVTLNGGATAFQIAPLRVVAGGRMMETTQTKTVAPSNVGALRTEYLVAHFDPIAGTAVIRTQTTAPVDPVDAGAGQQFQILLGTAQSSSTAPTLRNVWSRGVSQPQGVIRVDDIARLTRTDYVDGQPVWDETDSALYVKGPSSWLPATEGQRLHTLPGASWIVYTGATVFDGTRRVVFRYTLPARKPGIYTAYTLFDLQTYGNIRVDSYFAAGIVGGAEVIRGYHDLDLVPFTDANQGTDNAIKRNHSPLVVTPFYYPGGESWEFKGMIQRLGNPTGGWRNHAAGARHLLTYQPTTLAQLTLTNTAAYDQST